MRYTAHSRDAIYELEHRHDNRNSFLTVFLQQQGESLVCRQTPREPVTVCAVCDKTTIFFVYALLEINPQ